MMRIERGQESLQLVVMQADDAFGKQMPIEPRSGSESTLISALGIGRRSPPQGSG